MTNRRSFLSLLGLAPLAAIGAVRPRRGRRGDRLFSGGYIRGLSLETSVIGEQPSEFLISRVQFERLTIRRFSVNEIANIYLAHQEEVGNA